MRGADTERLGGCCSRSITDTISTTHRLSLSSSLPLGRCSAYPLPFVPSFTPLRSLPLRTTAYKRFRHPNIIRCLDSCVVQDKDEDGKVIYLFLPYYKEGT